jgi:hypothetical protein
MLSRGYNERLRRAGGRHLAGQKEWPPQLVPAFPGRNHFDAERSGSSTTDYETANVSLEFVVKSTAV